MGHLLLFGHVLQAVGTILYHTMSHCAAVISRLLSLSLPPPGPFPNPSLDPNSYSNPNPQLNPHPDPVQYSSFGASFIAVAQLSLGESNYYELEAASGALAAGLFYWTVGLG